MHIVQLDMKLQTSIICHSNHYKNKLEKGIAIRRRRHKIFISNNKYFVPSYYFPFLRVAWARTSTWSHTPQIRYFRSKYFVHYNSKGSSMCQLRLNVSYLLYSMNLHFVRHVKAQNLTYFWKKDIQRITWISLITFTCTMYARLRATFLSHLSAGDARYTEHIQCHERPDNYHRCPFSADLENNK